MIMKKRKKSIQFRRFRDVGQKNAVSDRPKIVV